MLLLDQPWQTLHIFEKFVCPQRLPQIDVPVKPMAQPISVANCHSELDQVLYQIVSYILLEFVAELFSYVLAIHKDQVESEYFALVHGLLGCVLLSIFPVLKRLNLERPRFLEDGFDELDILFPVHVFEVVPHAGEQLSQGLDGQLCEYLVGVADNATLIDLEDVGQEQLEVLEVLLNEFVDGCEQTGKRIFEPLLQLLLPERFRLGSVGDLFEGGPQYALHYHLPELVLEQLPIPHQDVKQEINRLVLDFSSEIPTYSIDCAQERQPHGLPKNHVELLVFGGGGVIRIYFEL